MICWESLGLDSHFIFLNVYIRGESRAVSKFPILRDGLGMEWVLAVMGWGCNGLGL